jgi:hypothetical protein
MLPSCRSGGGRSGDGAHSSLLSYRSGRLATRILEGAGVRKDAGAFGSIDDAGGAADPAGLAEHLHAEARGTEVDAAGDDVLVEQVLAPRRRRPG